MITHDFICDNCGKIIEDTSTIGIHKCPICGKDMRWNLDGIGIATGDYHHVSESLAINPNQVQEHKEKFPDVDVLSDGRIEFNSIKQHDDYLDKTGFVKLQQKTKVKGKTIAKISS